jgi:hypothetical protein
MLDPPSITRPLSSASDLAAFHARRERFYSVAAQLLAGAPDERLLDTARRLLGRGGQPVRDLVSALGDERRRGASAEHARLFGAAAAVDTRCATVQGGPDLVGELRHLATLADRLAGAIQAGDMSDAAALSDEQAHFLHDHAGACIADHARRIAATGGPFYQALGQALAQQIADDVRLLADDVSPS